jgi:hypothetical protein
LAAVVRPDGKKVAYCRTTEDLRGMNDRQFLRQAEIAVLELERSRDGPG